MKPTQAELLERDLAEPELHLVHVRPADERCNAEGPAAQGREPPLAHLRQEARRLEGADRGKNELLASQPGAARTRVGDTRRVLIVEDNRDARETLCKLLMLCGYQVETASDGIAGV